MWSFCCKAFLKSDTVAGLTRMLSLKWCLILVCSRNLIYEISVDLYLAPCNFIGCWRGVLLAERSFHKDICGNSTRKKFHKKFHKCTFNKAYLLFEMHSRWLPHEAGLGNAKSVQRCHQGKGWLLWRISNMKYIFICLTLFWLLHDSICVIS